MQLHVPREQPHVPECVSEVSELLVTQSLDRGSVDGTGRGCEVSQSLHIDWSQHLLSYPEPTQQHAAELRCSPFFTQTALIFLHDLVSEKFCPTMLSVQRVAIMQVTLLNSLPTLSHFLLVPPQFLPQIFH